MRRDITFASEGAELSGWFYVPAGPPPWPLVVMAHGYSATRHMTADKYAETLHGAGFAVLLFDHRGFGQSGGEPRRQINPWIQARGYRDAIAYGRTIAEVDPGRIALWGDSLSGGVALAVAAIDDRVAALVVQVPAIGAFTPPPDPDGRLFHALRETVLAGEVEASHRESYGPLPVVSEDQRRRPSALQPLTAYKWFIEYGGRDGTGWHNEVTGAQPRTPVPWHAALCARHVSCPALFVVSPIDEMVGARPAVARYAYDQVAGPKEWFEIEGGHFGLLYYPSDHFATASEAQARFLREHLGAKR